MNVEANSTDTTDGRHDDKPRPYWCNVCLKRFARRQSLNIHERMHTGERPFQCTECEKHFASPSTLHHHMNIHGNTSAQNVENVANAVPVAVSWQYTGEVIQERNRLNVLFVANDLHSQVTL